MTMSASMTKFIWILIITAVEGYKHIQERNLYHSVAIAVDASGSLGETDSIVFESEAPKEDDAGEGSPSLGEMNGKVAIPVGSHGGLADLETDSTTVAVEPFVVPGQEDDEKTSFVQGGGLGKEWFN